MTNEAIEKGDIWWAEMPEPRGSEPEYGRPVMVIQAAMFNRSKIRTILVASITTNLKLANSPGNVLLPASVSGLPKDSVVNVSQLIAMDRNYFLEPAGVVPARWLV